MIKANDIVKLTEKMPNIPDECLNQLGLVVKGPYEDAIVINRNTTVVSLVCDVMFNGNIYVGIPTSILLRL